MRMSWPVEVKPNHVLRIERSIEMKSDRPRNSFATEFKHFGDETLGRDALADVPGPAAKEIIISRLECIRDVDGAEVGTIKKVCTLRSENQGLVISASHD